MEFDKKAFYAEVGLRLQLIRKRRELTQEQVSAAIGVSRATYANLENGRQTAGLDVIWRAAVVLGVSVSDVVPEPIPSAVNRPAERSTQLPARTAAFRLVLPADRPS